MPRAKQGDRLVDSRIALSAARAAPVQTGNASIREREHDKKAARRAPGGLFLRGGADASRR